MIFTLRASEPEAIRRENSSWPGRDHPVTTGPARRESPLSSSFVFAKVAFCSVVHYNREDLAGSHSEAHLVHVVNPTKALAQTFHC
jgi:hypothetical protein